ncbi:MAG: TylF/MycF/NovP-related O-methyltransferase, partial [Bradyrhizobium sp.]
PRPAAAGSRLWSRLFKPEQPETPFRFAKQLVGIIDTLPTRQQRHFPELKDPVFWKFYHLCSPFSLVHVTGFYNVFQSIRHVAANTLPGDIVECGCFLGGVTGFLRLCCRHFGIAGKTIVVFDTFTGFTPGEKDIYMGKEQIGTQFDSFRNAFEINMREITGGLDYIRIVQGPVESTLQGSEIQDVCLIRLDTDYYSSTRTELQTLYPKLVPGGVLIVDDYGMFDGSRRATDEYIAGLDSKPLLNRIDIGIWSGVKP